VTSNSPANYNLSIAVSVSPSPQFGYKWTLDPGAGTLTNDTPLAPSHTVPATAGTGTLTLEPTEGGAATGTTANNRNNRGQQGTRTTVDSHLMLGLEGRADAW